MTDHGRVRNHGQRGFSLVEILAVIAVIAVLMALLLTALSAVKGQGQLTESMTNMRQVAAWMKQYASENRDHIVPSQFDYSDSSYPGKVRSVTPPNPVSGLANMGTWTDILWTVFELGPIADAPGVMSGYDYRFDSPDKPLYDELGHDLKNPFRATKSNRYDTINGDAMLPFGQFGALERGYPGFFAANDFFNARPDAPPLSTPTPAIGRWYVMGQIQFPDQSLYAVDSFAGEVIAPAPEPYDAITDLNGDGRPDTLEVDFRYSGACAILYLDGHVAPEGQWKDIDELEQTRRIRVRDLTSK